MLDHHRDEGKFLEGSLNLSQDPWATGPFKVGPPSAHNARQWARTQFPSDVARAPIS